MIESEASFLVCSMVQIFYISVSCRTSVNVLNVSTVCKYPPNAIFRSASINAQRANVTGSMNWHNTQLRSPM